MPKKKSPAFEEQLKMLESIAKKLEQPQTSLEEGLNLFEQGVGLVKVLQNTLQTAKMRVEMVLQNENGIETTPFNVSDEDEE